MPYNDHFRDGIIGVQRRGKIEDLFFFFLSNCEIVESRNLFPSLFNLLKEMRIFLGKMINRALGPSSPRLKSSSTRWYPLTTLLWPFKDKQDEDCRNVALSCSWETLTFPASPLLFHRIACAANCVNLIYISVEINPYEMRSSSREVSLSDRLRPKYFTHYSIRIIFSSIKIKFWSVKLRNG